MSQRNRRYRAALITAAAAALATGVLALAVPAQASATRVAIAGTEPTWADASTNTSQQVTSGTVTARVYLAGQDPAGLASYATAVSTPGNALYGHYLTPAQVMADYGPSAAQVGAVKSWLTGAGLTVTGAEDELGGYVAVTGPVQAAGHAFGVTFGLFKGPDGKTDRAPEQQATAPATVAGDVLGVDGLEGASHVMTPEDTLPPPGPNNWTAPPCSQYYGEILAFLEPTAYHLIQPWANCGYTPRQIRSAYHVSQSGMTGKGQTVAIVGAYDSSTILSDANEYAKTTGDPQFASGQYTQDLASVFTDTAADECNAPGWYSEQTADVEAVHGMAPAANIVYVGASSCSDSNLLAALALVVDNHLASIVSASWAEPFDQATLIATYDEVFQAGAAEGIGFFFPTGDHGYESPSEDPGSDQIQADWPAVSPFVTAVGGTSLAIGRSGNYEWETSWGTLIDPRASGRFSWEFTPPGQYPQDYGGSGGGGVSTFFPQPSYQAGVVPNSLATALPNGATSSTPMRVIPDVSAVADPGTGFLVGQTTLQPNGTTFAFSLSKTGGTSVATAIFAGIEADAQQAAGHAIGFADPAIYQRYGTSAFHDVTDQPLGPFVQLAEVSNAYTKPATKSGPLITDLRTLGINGEGAAALRAVKGYDDATGVGSPDLYIQSFS
jgi:subtilase family serine protease